MAIITLAQDKAGHLLLYREGESNVWVISGRGGRFQEDAVLLDIGPAERWDHSLTAYPLTTATYDGYERVVVWHGPLDWELVAMPNPFATQYLGLTTEEVRERFGGPSEGRPLISSGSMETRQRLYVEVSDILRGELESLARERAMSRGALVETLIREGVERMRQEQEAADARASA